jgi:GntR family transcriptional regulator
MFDTLDPRSPTPLYEQIAARIRLAVASGELEAGDALPSVRRLATEVRVNPATVVKAYRDLELEGFVTMKHGAGSFVNEMPTRLRDRERAEHARAMIHNLVVDAARQGISAQDLSHAFHLEVGRHLDEQRNRAGERSVPSREVVRDQEPEPSRT